MTSVPSIPNSSHQSLFSNLTDEVDVGITLSSNSEASHEKFAHESSSESRMSTSGNSISTTHTADDDLGDALQPTGALKRKQHPTPTTESRGSVDTDEDTTVEQNAIQADMLNVNREAELALLLMSTSSEFSDKPPLSHESLSTTDGIVRAGGVERGHPHGLNSLSITYQYNPEDDGGAANMVDEDIDSDKDDGDIADDAEMTTIMTEVIYILYYIIMYDCCDVCPHCWLSCNIAIWTSLLLSICIF